MAITKYALSRLVQGAISVLVIVIFVFILIQLAPGDPLTALVGDYPHTEAYEQEMRIKFGLDKPPHVQLIHYLSAMARLDFGYSFRYGAPVAEVVSERLGATVLLMLGAMVIAAIVGVPMGILSSLRPHSITDSMGTVISLAGYSLPVFWLGQIVILIFAINLGWLPAQGIQDVKADFTGWEHAVDVLKHLILPVSVLSLRYIGINSRITRASMLEVKKQDYITTARAKGLPERSVILKHAFRNALLPVVTVISINLGFVLTGSVLVESVFSWPGVGLLTYEAIHSQDYPLLLALFVMISIVVIAANFIADLAYALLDPRIKY